MFAVLWVVGFSGEMHQMDKCPLTVSIMVVFISSPFFHLNQIISRVQHIFFLRDELKRKVCIIFLSLDLAGLRLILSAQQIFNSYILCGIMVP